MSVKNVLKTVAQWVFPLFVIFWFPFAFYYDIAHYSAHSDDPFTCIFGFFCIIGCLICFIYARGRKRKLLAALYVLAVISCVFFCYWIRRIPFCTMCSPMKKSDLGFMLRPFADSFGDFWLPE